MLVPVMLPINELAAGQVGYVATGLKTLQDIDVGDTITLAAQPATDKLPGYRPLKPMVFAGLYPSNPEDYNDLRDALEKLQLNDAALTYEPESSQASVLAIAWAFSACSTWRSSKNGSSVSTTWTSSSLRPRWSTRCSRPTARCWRSTARRHCLTLPRSSTLRNRGANCASLHLSEHIGAVLDLVTKRRGELKNQTWLDTKRVEITCMIPLSEIIVDFYNELKARTKGYASMDYNIDEYRASDMVKLDVLVNFMPVDALSIIVHRESAFHKGQRLVSQDERDNPAPAVRSADPGGRGQPRLSAAPTSRRCARTCWPSAMAATSRASASCWRSRKQARSA